MWQDRVDAGNQLSHRLTDYKGTNALVVGIPRGGVIVAAQVAKALGLPLDIVVARKLGAPGNPELGIGALAPDGQMVLEDSLVRALKVDAGYIAAEADRQLKEIERREKQYRRGQTIPVWTGRPVILVDDGIATGGTVKAAALYSRRRGASEVVVAAPVAPPETAERFKGLVDKLIFLETPDFFSAVGAFYRDFSQTTDDEVQEAMAKS